VLTVTLPAVDEFLGLAGLPVGSRACVEATAALSGSTKAPPVGWPSGEVGVAPITAPTASVGGGDVWEELGATATGGQVSALDFSSKCLACSAKRVRSLETTSLPASFSSSARVRMRAMNATKATRTTGESGDATSNRSTCFHVSIPLSSAGETACPAAT